MRAFTHDIIIIDHAFGRLITTIDYTLDSGKRIPTRGIGCERFVYNEYLRLTIVENINDLRTCQANVERYNRRSHACAGIVQFEVTMAVEHKNSHTVTAHYTKRCQPAGKSISPLVKLFPGIACLSTSNRLPRSCYLFCVCQSLCNVHNEPPC